MLVYDGEVHRERGAAALPPYFAFLGRARLRALSVDLLDGMLQALGASRPTSSQSDVPWRHGEFHQELFPAIVEQGDVVTYVVHYALHTPAGIPRGSRPSNWPLVLQRWSLQLAPVVPDLDWKLEAQIERAAPPVILHG